MDNSVTPLRCFRERHALELFKDDSVKTVTSVEQKKVECSIQEVLSVYQQNHTLPQPALLREQHYVYLKKGLRHLSDAYECLDASRPWLCYWILHSLELLDEPVPASIASDVCKFLARCQSPTGGFAGGPGQHTHLAPTYAAINALCIIGTQEAYDVIDRQKLLDFLYSVKQLDGSFVMHVGGEVDVRSVYCAASVASLTNIITPTLFDGTPSWIIRCQNWEGGLGGMPGLEAHGGYTFCGTAAMVILGKEHMLDLKSLLHWVASRQMRFEGGFQGRCNKLVDGCYSFWQAGLLPLLHRALFKDGDSTLSMMSWMFDQQALQEYILLCCQNPAGGLLDKPGKSRDFYHTCYCLSGLSIAQHFGSRDFHHELILGADENRLAPTHPVYNICPEKVAQAVEHFHKLPIPVQTEAAINTPDTS
ncbi:protein farnesyltransferase subunit beta-like isoform X1 [Megalops cyprinoides]|uniref:protein farnesyltransferase subunit beta-like isoform X1 n=1 Tax=Megalops cyprinoides TaxID=118141 RepID=UPI001864D033|nr:protein farnesyltransferase subunit beta-like isoform X1 [Megalops cyprinoides]